jgi:hypothetical protein
VEIRTRRGVKRSKWRAEEVSMKTQRIRADPNDVSPFGGVAALFLNPANVWTSPYMHMLSSFDRQLPAARRTAALYSWAPSVSWFEAY